MKIGINGRYWNVGGTQSRDQRKRSPGAVGRIHADNTASPAQRSPDRRKGNRARRTHPETRRTSAASRLSWPLALRNCWTRSPAMSTACTARRRSPRRTRETPRTALSWAWSKLGSLSLSVLSSRSLSWSGWTLGWSLGSWKKCRRQNRTAWR